MHNYDYTVPDETVCTAKSVGIIIRDILCIALLTSCIIAIWRVEM